MSAPRDLTPELLAAWPLPPISEDGDKEARGRVLVLAAGAQVAGATLLTATAALRAGAGKLQIAAPRTLAQALAFAIPEARILPASETPDGELAPAAAGEIAAMAQRADAVVVGPGMLDEASAGELALRLLEGDGPPIVVDAAAMPGLAAEPQRIRGRGGRMVLTPHAGELAALAGCTKPEVVADPLNVGRKVAGSLRSVVVVKGAETFIVSPDGTAWRREAHTVGLATSGSGDVLAGVIAGLLGRGASPAQAAAWGVLAHAQAGVRLAARIGRLGFLARELVDEVAPILHELEVAPMMTKP